MGDQGRLFWRRLHGLVRDVDLNDPRRGAGTSLDRRSLADLMNELGIDGRARFLLERGIRDDCAVEPARLSLLFVALSERAGWNQPDGGVEAYRLRGRARGNHLSLVIPRSRPDRRCLVWNPLGSECL